ncbi:MAG: glutathione S-transferase family protein [Alphaproteobacteria bacterium]|nr:glutathione S-transferase family protein [Alphaproteobacteria bacterium]
MYHLDIGNKNYSSWSLRPWVLLKALDIPFSEDVIPFHDHEAWAAYRKLAPSGLVPLLQDGELLIWDSIAIAEYLAERHKGVWPRDARARAYARSAAAEMHSGFSTLRAVCGMNIGVRVTLNDAAKARLAADLARIEVLWLEGLERFGGPYLGGDRFSAADAFFCPVAFRVQTYGIALSDKCRAYVDTLLAHPAMREWYEAGLREPFRDWPHEDEIAAAGTLTADFRAPGINPRPESRP